VRGCERLWERANEKTEKTEKDEKAGVRWRNLGVALPIAS
jgi:hypothetical protein